MGQGRHIPWCQLGGMHFVARLAGHLNMHKGSSDVGLSNTGRYLLKDHRVPLWSDLVAVG